MAKSFEEWNNLGKMADFPGTRITPIYFELFLGDISKLISNKGEPLTLINSNNNLVNSSDRVAYELEEDPCPSNRLLLLMSGPDFKYLEKLP